jgi:phenylalanyl-tRNA synthetase beta chain
VRIVAAPRAGFGKSASGRIEWDGQTIGYLGKIDRAVTEKLGLREIPAAAELELLPLVEGALLIPTQKPIPTYPTVRRDLSLVVPDATPFERIADLIRDLKLDQLQDVEYVTTYRGKPLAAGTKSVTVTFVFRSATGTLTSEAVDANIARVVEAAQQQLSATLRA